MPLPDAVPDETACQLIAMPLSGDAAAGEACSYSPARMDGAEHRQRRGPVKTLAGLAKARGVNVVNLVRRDAGIAELAALGIGNAVSTEQPGWKRG